MAVMASLTLIFIFVVSLVAIKVAKWLLWPPATTLRPKHSLNQSRAVSYTHLTLPTKRIV